MIEAWIDKEGAIHEGGNHLQIAQRLFPKSKNSELTCEKLGYVKLGTLWNSTPMMENFSKETSTQAQINTVTYLWDKHYREENKLKEKNESN